MPYDGAPTIYKNVLLVGTNFYGPGERHIGPQLDQAGGQIPEQHGYDVRTGKELWTFHTFPQPGEVGNDTWAKDSWKNRTGNNVWAFALTVDEEHGIVYEPVSGPGANFYGGDRPGANLFGNTLVALDADDRQAEVVFPDRSPRAVGLQPAARARPDRHQAKTARRFRRWRRWASPATCSSWIA